MKIAVSTQGNTLDAPVEMRFGRAKGFIVFDDQSREHTYLDNTQNADLPQSAGIQTAQMVANAGAKVVITGQVGPKAQTALEQGGIEIHYCGETTVGQALEAFQNGRTEPMPRQTAPQQGAGNRPGFGGTGPLGRGSGAGGGFGGRCGGRGMGRGGRCMGRGMGQGMGGGMGRGMGGGMGRGFSPGTSPALDFQTHHHTKSLEERLKQLEDEAERLRERLRNSGNK